MEISEKDKLGMKSLIAAMEEKAKAKEQPLPRPRPKPATPKRRKPTPADVKSGAVSQGDANDEMMMRGIDPLDFKHGGKVDGAAIRGKTKGRVC